MPIEGALIWSRVSASVAIFFCLQNAAAHGFAPPFASKTYGYRGLLPPAILNCGTVIGTLMPELLAVSPRPPQVVMLREMGELGTSVVCRTSFDGRRCEYRFGSLAQFNGMWGINSGLARYSG